MQSNNNVTIVSLTRRIIIGCLRALGLLGFLGLMSLLCYAAPPYTSVSFDFDTVGQLTNNFNARISQSAGGAAAIWAETNALGVGSSRAVDAMRSTSDEVTLIYSRNPFNFSQPGLILNASMMFKYKAPSLSLPATRLLDLGFLCHTNQLNTNAALTTLGSSNMLFASQFSWAWLAARMDMLNPTNQNTALFYETRAYLDSTTKKGWAGATNTLTPGTWYKLTLQMTNNRTGTPAVNSNTIVTASSLQAMGTDGLVPGDVIYTVRTIATNQTLLTNANLYFGFSPVEAAGIDAVDNVAVWTTDGAPVVTGEPVSQSVLQNRSVTLSVFVDGTPPYRFQWMKDSTDIPGATKRTLTIAQATSSDAGIYTVRVANDVSSVTSAEATLTVTPDAIAPNLVSVGSLDGYRVGVRFDEAVSPATATVVGNYSVTGGGTVTNVTLRPDGQSVELFLDTPTSGNFTVSINGVQDLASNPISPATASGNVLGLTAFDVAGPEGLPPLTEGYSYTSQDGEIDVRAGGQELAGTADDGHLVLGVPRVGDFDVKVRVQNLVRSTLWNVAIGNDEMARAALMARESASADSRVWQIAVAPKDFGNPAGQDRYEISSRGATGAAMTNYPHATLMNTNPAPQGWMRLRRMNNTITMLRSWNGLIWTNLATFNDPTLPESMLVGLGATAHTKPDVANAPVFAEFRNFGEVSFPNAVLTNNIVLRPAATNLNVPAAFTITALASVAGVTNEMQFIWQRTNSATGGWTNVPFASSLSSNLTTPTFTYGDEADFSSWSWRCIVKVAGQPAVTSSISMVTGHIDTNAARLVDVVFPPTSVKDLVLTFNKPLEINSALNLGNYQLTNSLGEIIPLTGISLMVNGPTNAIALLTAADALPAGNNYGLVITNLLDWASPPNRTTNTFRRFNVSPAAPSLLALQELYQPFNNPAASGPGYVADVNHISQFTNSPVYKTNGFRSANYVSTMAWTAADNAYQYDGTRVSSFFIPPTTDNYKFYIRGDDSILLRMNTSTTGSTDPAGMVQLAVLPTWDGNNPNYGVIASGISGSVRLNAGQRYYMELLHRNGTGGDYSAVTWRYATDANIPPNTEVIGAPYLELPKGAAAVATVNPANPQVVESSYVTFSARGISGAGPYFLRWFRNGIDLGVEYSQIYDARIGPFTCNDSNITFQVSNLWSVARFVVPISIVPDTVKPTVVGVTADGSLSRVYITYSEGMNPASALNPQNYSIPGLTVLSGYMLSNNTVAVLRTTPQAEGQTYTVSINEQVRDGSCVGNFLDPVSYPFTAWIVARGLVMREFYMNILGGNISDLTSNPKYINHQPDTVDVNTSAVGAGNVWTAGNIFDHYGTVMYGYFIPPVTGPYTFYTTYDDGVQILFSSDDAVENATTRYAAGCCVGSAFGSASFSVNLISGRKYYFEGRVKEHEGDDYFGIGVRLPTDSATPGAPMSGMVIEAAGDPNSPRTPTLGITQQPANTDVVENLYATFSVVATNSANWPMAYQWQRNGVDIPGATSAQYSTRVRWSDDGTVFRVVVKIPGRIVYSADATVNVLADTVCPTISAAFGDLQSNTLTVVFSEEVNPSSATNAANYTFSGGLLVTNAIMVGSGNLQVLLTVDGDIVNGTYTVTARDIMDIANVPNTICPNPCTSPSFTAPWPFANGYVQVQVYSDIQQPWPVPVWYSTNWALSILTENPNYPNRPSYALYTNVTDWPQTDTNLNGGVGLENYGARMTGFIVPPVTGNYRFQIFADDSTRLTLSPVGELKAGTVLINTEMGAGCAACGGPQSAPVTLIAGHPYSFEAIFLEGTGGDYMRLFWQMPGEMVFTNIFSTNIGFAVNPDTVRLVTTVQPTNVAILEGRTTTLACAASATVGIPTYQWQQFDPGSAAWVDIPNANSTSYNPGILCTVEDPPGSGIYLTVPRDIRYRAVIGLSLLDGLVTRTNITDEATVTVLPDEVAPAIVSVGSLDGNSIGVVFSEPVVVTAAFSTFDNWRILDANIAGNLYYTNEDGTCMQDEFGECIPTYYDYPVSSVLPWPDTNALVSDKFILILNGHFSPNVSGEFTVHCWYAEDVACRHNSIDSESLSIPQGLQLVDIWNPLPAGSAFVGNTNRIEARAGGYDIWLDGDQFTYLYRPVAGDFDARVTVIGIPEPPAVPPNTWSKAGLMVRGSIIGEDPINLVTNSSVGAATNSLMAYMVATPTNGANVFASGIRFANGMQAVDLGPATRQTITGIYPSNAFPVQVRMVRAENLITTYYWGYVTNLATNVETLEITTNLTSAWVSTGSSQTTNWPSQLFIGLATTSHAQGSAVNATYEDFKLIGGPSITLQPVGGTNRIGESFTFTVAGTGPAEGDPIRYQWRLNDTSIPGANAASYTITSASAADIGLYTVEVRNSAGAVTSAPVYLKVLVPPTIVSGPDNLTVQCLGDATNQVQALGNEPGEILYYQWRLNGIELVGETSSTLIVNYVTPDRVGPYSVVVSNEFGATISPDVFITLTDTNAPMIMCPDNMTVECGVVVTYTVPATNACGAPVPVTCVPASGATFTVGTTTVNCSTDNPTGPIAACSFTVTAADTQAPVIASCQTNILTTNTVVDWPQMTANDACAGNLVVSCVPPSGSTFSAGTNTVVCQASDPANLTATCSFLVIVGGQETPPQLTITREPDGNLTVSWPASATGYQLEVATTLGYETPADWQVYGGTINTNGDVKSAPITVGGTTHRFYRLHKP